jgi:hypothetical protein
MKRDMQQRVALRRIDDGIRQNKVSSAREIIYEKNYAVDTEHVEMLLKAQSLVPTAVNVT